MKRKIFICFLSLVLLLILILPNFVVSASNISQTYIPITFSEIPDYLQEHYNNPEEYSFCDSYYPYPVLPISFTDEYKQYATGFRKQYPQRYISVLDFSWGRNQFINRIYCNDEQGGIYECDLYDTYDYAVYATNIIWCKTLLLDQNWENSNIDIHMSYPGIKWKDSTPKEVNCANGKKIYLITKVENYTDTIRVTVSAWQFIEDKYAVVIGMYADVEKDSYNEQVKNYYETLATRLAEGTTVLQIPLTAADSEIDAMIAAVDTDSFSITVPDYINHIPSKPINVEDYYAVIKPSVDRWCNYPEELRPGYVPESSEDFGTSEEPSQEVSEEISDVTSDDVSVEESSYSAESVADAISAEESGYSPKSNGGESSKDNESRNVLIAVITVAGALAVCAVVLLIVFKPKKKEE